MRWSQETQPTAKGQILATLFVLALLVLLAVCSAVRYDENDRPPLTCEEVQDWRSLRDQTWIPVCEE